MKWSADGLRLWRRIQTATLDVSLIPLITANIGCVVLATTIYPTKLHKLHGCMSSYCNSSLFMMKLRTKIVAKFGIENQRLETKGKKKWEKIWYLVRKIVEWHQTKRYTLALLKLIYSGMLFVFFCCYLVHAVFMVFFLLGYYVFFTFFYGDFTTIVYANTNHTDISPVIVTTHRGSRRITSQKFRQKGRRKIWGKFEEWVQPDTSANTKHYATAIPNTANFGCAAEAPMIW